MYFNVCVSYYIGMVFLIYIVIFAAVAFDGLFFFIINEVVFFVFVRIVRWG